jgi:hypothetical protein
MDSSVRLRDKRSKLLNSHAKETQFLQVVITLFYGQFLSQSIFENFVRTIPDMLEEESAEPYYQLVIKVSFGSFIFVMSIVSLLAVWKHYFKIIMISGILLFATFITTLLLATIQLTLKFEEMTISERFKMIAKLAFEAVFQLVGMGATFQINLLAQLETQNKIISELMEQVDSLQINFDNILPILTKNIGLDPKILSEILSNIQTAKKAKVRVFGPSRASRTSEYSDYNYGFNK